MLVNYDPDEAEKDIPNIENTSSFDRGKISLPPVYRATVVVFDYRSSIRDGQRCFGQRVVPSYMVHYGGAYYI
mgnify:CR=1 FL=1